jgi:hypothetical protein
MTDFPKWEIIKSVNQAGLRGVMPRDYVYRIAGQQHWSFCMKELSPLQEVLDCPQ